MRRHAAIGYPQSWDAGFAVRAVRVGPVHLKHRAHQCAPGASGEHLRPLLDFGQYGPTASRSQGACARPAVRHRFDARSLSVHHSIASGRSRHHAPDLGPSRERFLSRKFPCRQTLDRSSWPIVPRASGDRRSSATAPGRSFERVTCREDLTDVKAIALDIPGVLLIEPALFHDQRGLFCETYHAQRYADAGISERFVQDNFSRSVRGTLRGLHYQEPHAQGKLVMVVEGAVYDVVVDIRIGSPTFGTWQGVDLSSDNYRQLYIPPGLSLIHISEPTRLLS